VLFVIAPEEMDLCCTCGQQHTKHLKQDRACSTQAVRWIKDLIHLQISNIATPCLGSTKSRPLPNSLLHLHEQNAGQVMLVFCYSPGTSQYVAAAEEAFF